MILLSAMLEDDTFKKSITACGYVHKILKYKTLNKLSPESLWDKYQYRSAYSNYITRNCKDLQMPRLKTEHAKKGFYYSALKAWNDIPANIREIQTLGRFKKELKAHPTS